MALNKTMKAALKALSYPDIKLKKNYKMVRTLVKVTHPAYLPPYYKKWDHEVVCEGHTIPVRVFSPDETTNHPVMIFFHGGGWVTGDIDSYTRVCAHLAKHTGHVVVSVDYRLAPEHKFPAAPNDCYFVTKEIFLNSQELFGIEPEDITLIGDSAGGNLAAVVALMARDRKEFQPKRQILIYPAVNNDFSENSPFPSIQENGTDYLLTITRLCDYMDLYKSSDADRDNPYFAPLMAKDFSDQPKTLIITAEYDPLRDEGEYYGKRLAEAGNEVDVIRVEDALHGFFRLSEKYPQIQECYDMIKEFLYDEIKENKQMLQENENENKNA